MKFKLFAPLAALAALAVLSGPASVMGDQITLYQGYFSYSNGGEFGAILTNSSLPLAAQGQDVHVTGYDFQTFCIEYSEEFYPGHAYNVGAAKSATLGGKSVDDRWAPDGDLTMPRTGQNADGTVGSDPICQETAYLYRLFWDGDLKDYDYANSGVGRSTSAGQLQEAIWYLEGEQDSLTSGSQAETWVELAHAAVLKIKAGTMTDPRFDKAYNTSLFGVAALNLVQDPDNKDGLASDNRQSQLVVLTGDYNIVVPVPAAAWMGMSLLGLLGVGHLVKRHVAGL